MEHARHIFRVLLLLLLLVAGVVVARTIMIPKSFGVYGNYRYDNVAEQRNKPVMHHGAKSCAGCHEKQWTRREDGEMHVKVSCEVCHGPLAIHATGDKKGVDKKIGDMPIDKTWKLCARCHTKLEGRPAKFPQIIFNEKHTKGDPIEGNVCKQCHDPHSTMPEEDDAAEGDAKDSAKPADAKDAVKPADAKDAVKKDDAKAPEKKPADAEKKTPDKKDDKK